MALRRESRSGLALSDRHPTAGWERPQCPTGCQESESAAAPQRPHRSLPHGQAPKRAREGPKRGSLGQSPPARSLGGATVTKGLLPPQPAEERSPQYSAYQLVLGPPHDSIRVTRGHRFEIIGEPGSLIQAAAEPLPPGHPSDHSLWSSLLSRCKLSRECSRLRNDDRRLRRGGFAYVTAETDGRRRHPD